MRFEDRVDEQDANTLPYLLRKVGTELRIQVKFEWLHPVDLPELAREPWGSAVFTECWQRYAQIPGQALKVHLANVPDAGILGLVHPGTMGWMGGPVRKSLLEASPAQCYSALDRRYAGIGRVLMARLVVESYQQGGEGRVIVAARPGSELFYKRLGFRGVPNTERRFLLDRAAAAALLDSVLE